MKASEFITEKWSAKYKRSINCNNPKGFSQRAHCQGRKKKVNEASPDTLEGSFTRDLILSKCWLANKLKKELGNNCARTIYIVGSWYGNLAILLQKAGIVFDDIVLIDKDDKALFGGEKLLKSYIDSDKLKFIHTDAKDVVYDEPGIIINTSVNDMSTDWYDNVPDNFVIIVQGRDNSNSATRFDNLDRFANTFPMRKTNYLGCKKFKDPETAYSRFMKIGVK